MPFLALLNGMPGKVIATVIGSMALVAALLLWLNAHDNRVLSAQAGRDAALVAAAQQTQEIGRASCRERVCVPV